MESESIDSGKTGERPVTRWRRGYEDVSSASSKMQRPATGVTLPQNKFERPKSRRGGKDEIDSHSTSGSNRSATPGRSSFGRAPSASILSNRVPTGSSRLNTVTSNNFGRLNTALPTSGQISINVLERPITQHGIAGVRPGTTRGLPMTRQIQDKRYYVGLMQLKVRELTSEIADIMKDIDDQNKKRATFLHYDKRAKDLATKLNTLQEELADYNIVVDKMTSDIGKESIEHEAEALASKNDHTLIEIEKMFDERKKLEHSLGKMQKQLENEKKRTERLIQSMDASTREKYDNLSKEKAELQEKTNKIQQELDALSKEQAYLEEEIALSPLKQEAVKLHIKIIEAEEKRQKLREEEQNRLSPEEERERLLQKIKQDNMDIAAAEAQLSEKNKRIEEVEQELEQLETDMEDTQSEKQIKYKELRKREDVIEQFMSSFDQNKEDDMEKLEKLEKTIVKHLEVLSNTLDISIDFAVGDEMAILNSMLSHDDRESHDQSFEGLTEEHLKLKRILKKMEMLEQQLKMESVELNENINANENKLITLVNLNNLQDSTELKQEELTMQREQLKEQQSLSEKELEKIQDEYNKINLQLEANETYIQISLLESKLEKLKEDHKKIESFINEQKDRANYGPLKDRAYNLSNDYGTVLKESLKSVY